MICAPVATGVEDTVTPVARGFVFVTGKAAGTVVLAATCDESAGVDPAVTVLIIGADELLKE